MTSKRGKRKEALGEDFEISVLNRLSEICHGLNELKGSQVLMQRDIESLKDQVKEHIANSSINKFWKELKKQQEKVKL